MRQVLLIAAHGSSTEERARRVVQDHTARIAALVPHVQCATGFAKGEPSMLTAFRGLFADATEARTVVTVVPFMTSAGFYAREVLPRLLADSLAHVGAERVSLQITKPVGASRRVATILHRRALRLAAARRWSPQSVSLVIAGHGTRRHTASRDTAQAHATALATRGWQSVHAAFIDDDPGIAGVVAALPARNVIVLPFLMGGAAHHLVDVPQALGFAPGDADHHGDAGFTDGPDGQRIVLDAPLGSDPALVDIAADLASRAWQRNLRGAHRTSPRRGTVHLVGAGPGAADLISVRGQRALRQADVILHDRLVSAELLAMARPDARLIDVGKAPDTPQSSQLGINEVLVAEARAGHRVVRLKGGDPFVFGRGSEEWEACVDAGIAVRVTPGITSALAAPSLAGVPVTARHVSRGFAVMTASTDEEELTSAARLRDCAHVDTLVVMMGRSRLRSICADQVTAGREPDTPVTCIERASLPDQRVVRGTLVTIADAADAVALVAPMVIVIGATAGGFPPHIATAAAPTLAAHPWRPVSAHVAARLPAETQTCASRPD